MAVSWSPNTRKSHFEKSHSWSKESCGRKTLLKNVVVFGNAFSGIDWGLGLPSASLPEEGSQAMASLWSDIHRYHQSENQDDVYLLRKCVTDTFKYEGFRDLDLHADYR